MGTSNNKKDKMIGKWKIKFASIINAKNIIKRDDCMACVCVCV